MKHRISYSRSVYFLWALALAPFAFAQGSPVVRWNVRQVQSGILEVNGVVPAGVDLTNDSIARPMMHEGCLRGRGQFGTIRLFQDGQLAAESNLGGCNVPGTVGVHRNYVAERKYAAAKAIAMERARDTDQGVINTRGLERDIIREINATVAEQKAFPACRLGCKDFEVACTYRETGLGRADVANGIAEGRFVVLSLLRYGPPTLGGVPGAILVPGQPSQWNEQSTKIHYRKIDGRWTKVSSSSVSRSEACGR